MPRRIVERPEYAIQIRDRLREQRQRAIEGLRGGVALSHALSDIIDHAIRRLFDAVCEEVQVDLEGADLELPALVILATGGYGRRDLSPGSDVDIAFVPSEEGHPGLDEVVRRMYVLLMDLFTIGAELKVGYAYRLIDDCDGLEHPTQTALLDARPVAGSAELAYRFTDALMEHLRPAAFAHHKDRERRAAWAKHGGTVFAVEPQLKEGPGGLRDYQAAGWIARARFGMRHGNLWPEIRGLGLIGDRELQQIAAARELLQSVRHQLHIVAGRQNDTLSAARQEVLAPMFRAGETGLPGVVPFMRPVFDAMEVLHGAYLRIAESCLEGPLALDRRLLVRRGRIHATDRDLLDDDPTALSRIFHHFMEFGFRPDRELEETLAIEFRRDSAPLRPAALAPLLMALLGAERSAPALRLMFDLRLLDRALPEFAATRTLTPLSVVHRCAVGEHTLRCLEAIESLPTCEGDDLRELARLATSAQRIDVLRLALLLHDIGKADPSRNHAETGAAAAAGAAERLGLDPESRDLLVFLVRHHQSMSETAQLRDLTHDQTVRDFCAAVSNVERLELLYLMTYADMSATGPGIWTAVAARFIQDLYYRAEGALVHGLPDPGADANLSGYRRRMRQELSLHNLPEEEVEEHCARMPASYLLNTPLEEIAAHVRAVERLKPGSLVVDFLPGPGGQATVLTLCTYDDPAPGLLSKIAAVLYANDIEVHSAQVYTREGEPRVAIDTLWTEFHGAELPPLKRRDLERDLLAVIAGKLSAEALLQRRGKRVLCEPVPRIELLNHLSERHTVVEVDSADSRGLLYRVTSAMSRAGWDIHSARVSTLDGEARDAFYVTDAFGRKLPDDPGPLVAGMSSPGA